MLCYNIHTFNPLRWVASRTPERIVHPLVGRKVPEGTGLTTLPEEPLMSQVTYRGVSYDTVQRRQAQAQQQQTHVVSEAYRGIKYNKEVR